MVDLLDSSLRASSPKGKLRTLKSPVKLHSHTIDAINFYAYMRTIFFNNFAKANRVNLVMLTFSPHQPILISTMQLT